MTRELVGSKEEAVANLEARALIDAAPRAATEPCHDFLYRPGCTHRVVDEVEAGDKAEAPR